MIYITLKFLSLNVVRIIKTYWVWNKAYSVCKYFTFSHLLFYLKTRLEHLYNKIHLTDIPLHSQLQKRLEDVIKIEIKFNIFNNSNFFSLYGFSP
jgi:hypothetical protein